MAVVKIIKGDLLQLFAAGEFQAIGHGANCKNLMGAGIARQIAAKLPEAFQADAEMYTRLGGQDNYPCHALAGQISVASVVKGLVFNLYTQVQTGKNADYQLLQTACENLNKYCKGRSIKRVGLPLIGAGIGGLDMVAVSTIINACTPDIDVTLVVWQDDALAWKTLVRKFKNFGFPNVFHGFVQRVGQNTFRFTTDGENWYDENVDLADVKVIWHNGQNAGSFSDTLPDIFLFVSSEEEAQKYKSQLI